MERIYNKIDTKVLSEINKTTEIVAISVAIGNIESIEITKAVK